MRNNDHSMFFGRWPEQSFISIDERTRHDPFTLIEKEELPLADWMRELICLRSEKRLTSCWDMKDSIDDIRREETIVFVKRWASQTWIVVSDFECPEWFPDVKTCSWLSDQMISSHSQSEQIGILLSFSSLIHLRPKNKRDFPMSKWE